jgi:hypothetical protein
MMAKIFQISNAIRRIAQDAIDDLIDQLGKDVKLVYPPTPVPCSCGQDLIGKKGPHIWSHGGPSPRVGSCVYCGGSGQKHQEQTETIRLLCNWDSRTFDRITNPDIRMRQSGSTVQTKGYISDLPKILKCSYAIFQVAIQGIQEYRFRLVSDPTNKNNIVPNRYFIAIWERVGG